MDTTSSMENFFNDRIKEGLGGLNGHIVLPKTKEDAIQNRELFLQRLDELGINKEEIQPILEDYGSQLIEACAGAGKTTLIVLKLIYDAITGADLKVVTYGGQQQIVKKNILVSTFLNSGAKDLKQSFLDWSRKIGVQGITSDHITFKTIHAEVMKALNDMGVPTPIIKQTDSIVRKLMQELRIRNINAKGYNPTIDEVRDITGLLGYARNIMDEKRYRHHLMNEYGMNDLLLDLLVKRYKEEIKLLYGYDYEYLQETLYEGMTMNPVVKDYINNRYDMVIVDEFQDTSQLQYELLKEYFANKQVIVVGDSDQTIYTFRGSDIDIILKRFPQDFNPKVHTLTYNYRCRSNILNAVSPCIAHNKNRYPKQLRAATEGGHINIYKSPTITHLVGEIDKSLERQHTVGVVTRMNVDLLMPAILIELEDKYNYSLSKGVSLTNKLPKQIISIMELITKRYSDEFKTILATLLPRQAQREANTLASTLAINPNINVFTMDVEDVAVSCPKLYRIIYNLQVFRKQEQEYKSKNEKPNHLIGDKAIYVYLLDYMRAEIFTQDSTYANNAREFIDFMIDLIENHPKLQNMTLEAIHHLFTHKLPAQMTSRQGYIGNSVLKLTTIHEAKGKEWDTVIMWNVIDGKFPVEHPTMPLTEENIEEERRVFYIGATRGKHNLTIYTQYNAESMFLQECDFTQLGYNAPPEVDTNVIYNTNNLQQDATSTVTEDVLLQQYLDNRLSTASIGSPISVDIQLVQQYFKAQEGVRSTQALLDVLNNLGVNFYLDTGDVLYNKLDKAMTALSDQLRQQVE